jgi:hypothetical protein
VPACCTIPHTFSSIDLCFSTPTSAFSSYGRVHGLYIKPLESSPLSTETTTPCKTSSRFKSKELSLHIIMDDAWVQHVTAILEYLRERTQSPSAEACQSARDLMLSLDAWSFLGSASHYGLQVRALEILQRLAYHDPDHGPIRDIASWVLEGWLRVLQRYPRSVQALRGQANLVPS